MKVPIVNLTFEEQLVKIGVLAVYMSEDGQVLGASFEWEGHTERVRVRSCEEAVLYDIVKGSTFLQHCLLIFNEYMHIIYGILVSCYGLACRIPPAPVSCHSHQ